MTNTTGPAQHTIRRVLDARRQQPGALLPILYAIQDELGHVPPEAVAEIAEALNLLRALRADAARCKSMTVIRPSCSWRDFSGGLWLRHGPAGLHIGCADMSLRRKPRNLVQHSGMALRATKSVTQQ